MQGLGLELDGNAKAGIVEHPGQNFFLLAGCGGGGWRGSEQEFGSDTDPIPKSGPGDRVIHLAVLDNTERRTGADREAEGRRHRAIALRLGDLFWRRHARQQVSHPGCCWRTRILIDRRHGIRVGGGRQSGQGHTHKRRANSGHGTHSRKILRGTVPVTWHQDFIPRLDPRRVRTKKTAAAAGKNPHHGCRSACAPLSANRKRNAGLRRFRAAVSS